MSQRHEDKKKKKKKMREKGELFRSSAKTCHVSLKQDIPCWLYQVTEIEKKCRGRHLSFTEIIQDIMVIDSV